VLIRKGARFGMLTIAGGMIVTVLVLGLTAVVKDARSRSVAAAGETALPAAPKNTKTRARPQPVRAPQVVPPIIGEGQKDLGDGVFAVRTGDDVTVNFDTETLRTRFDWKFEGIVRVTLPQLYGAEVGAALDSIPNGRFVRGGDLLADLPTRGVTLSLPRGRAIHVWPVVRPGRDGPIVVAYRASGR